MKKKLIFLSIILTVTLFIFIPKTFAETDAKGSEIVELPEELREFLCMMYDYNYDNKISEAEIQNIDFMQIPDYMNISDFSFMIHFNNLKGLRIQHIDIDDLSFLENFNTLETLRLNFCNLSDISKLSNLVNLKELELTNNNISDISCLERLVNLERLKVDNNTISDASVINNFPKLIGFTITNNNLAKIPNMSNIEAFYRIEKTDHVYTDFSDNKITDISNLSNSKLKILNLRNNKITDISPIATIENLQRLDLSKNLVTDISCLNPLTNLDFLNLDYNNITNISGIEGLSNLTALYLAENKISDISMLTELQNLKYISVVDTEVNPYDEATFHVICTLKENGKRLTIGDCSKFEPQNNYTTEETENVKVNDEEITILPVVKETNIIDFIIKEKFPSLKDDNIKVVDKDGKPKSNTEKLGSRNVIKIEDEQGNILAEFTVVVPGDITGNGYARMYDAFQILKDTIIPGATLDAIDIKIRDHNGDKNVRMYDAFQFLKDSILG